VSEIATVGRKAAAGIDEVAAKLRNLRDEARRAAGQDQPGQDDASVANMRAYLALRRHDNRALQASPARLGLSSLGRSEGHVLARMLNKGPMIVAAIAALDDILVRMATHRHKKTSLLRRLRAWTPEPAI
jgi:hypothetical protein